MHSPKHPAPVTVGLDIGATKWLATAVDAKSRAEVSRGGGQVTDEPSASLNAVTRWLSSLADERRYYPAAVGCSFAGTVDSTGSVAAWPNRPAWVGAPVLHTLGAGCGIEVTIEDDGVCSALGEKSDAGVAKTYDDFLCVCLGTGVGSALFLNSQLRTRPGCEPLSIGHFRVGGKRDCRCGSRGCLQTVISGAADRTQAGVARLAELTADLARLLALEALVFTGGLLEHIPDLPGSLATGNRQELRGTACDVLISSRPSMSALNGALALAEQRMGIAR